MKACLVHIITHLELGGAQRATLDEISGVTFEGPRYLMSGQGGELEDEARRLNNVTFVPLRHMTRPLAPLKDALAVAEVATKLSQISREHRLPLIVHTHCSKAGIIGRWAAKMAGAEHIVHSIHGWGHRNHGSGVTRRMYLYAERATSRVTDAYTADAQSNFEDGLADRILGAQSRTVVHCGIDPGRYASPERPPESVRAEIGVPPDAPTILSLACLKPQKDPVGFLNVARLTLQRAPEAHFLLAGDGVLRSEVERLRIEMGLVDRVHLLGWRRDVVDLLHAADVFILTSRWEGLPQVFAQAMAAGTPIVATRVDGAPEAIEHGVNGFLVGHGQWPQMARHVDELVRQPQLRRRLVSQAKASLEPFTVETMLRRVESVYRSADI